MTHTATTAAPPQRVLLAIVTLPLLFGCGGGPFDYVPASGRVTYEDGQPLQVGKVIFKSMAPAVGGAHPRPAGADLNPDGTFDSVTSHKPGDGLVPGKHTVAIMFAVDENGNSLVPAEYTNIATTPITVDTADAPFQITIPRP
ncbi:hypothetical protein KOR34_01810 [Posidoniimonas corsicana]|uniref:Carboxypeptidase regulatory-like domain-containing protein n=1 Tax=Posidoniimonas corsicana TaxID=1938618 RepID=A0A5C5VBC6_9BACT|nr:hypothetical protein [Posidoniimonas corsicana]TWT35293.1 hypothetical protein KOR34_01810 [Posidoniimonas corsicana]